MPGSRTQVATLATLAVVAAWVLIGAGQQPPGPGGPLPLAPLGVRGEAIFPAFEGWGPHKDGTNVLLVGYFNRNKEQTLDIPIGPNNRIEPGGPDYGQPTHFKSGRQYGVFAIALPKDFGTKRLTWTLVANGQTSVVTMWMNPPYWVDFFKNTSTGNEPPVIRFSETGSPLTGPPRELIAQTLSGAVGQPVPLSLWASDHPNTTVFDPNPRPEPAGRGRGRGRGGEPPSDITVNWSMYRGPADVTIAESKIPLTTKGDEKLVLEAKTTATFSAPGEYWLLATVNDLTGDGGGGDQCCWTSAHVKVMVK
jgi:hypothetical protein